MSAKYGDQPETPHRHGYMSRWPARKTFLSAVYRLAPHVHEFLLDPNAVAAALEPAGTSTVKYPSQVGNRIFRPLLFDRRDGLFADANWLEQDFSAHPDYGFLPEGDVRRIDMAMERWGRKTLLQEWSNREVSYQDLGLPVKDAMRLFSHSDDDGQTFGRQLHGYSPSLLGHLTRWARRFNIDVPWTLMTGGLTIFKAADNPNSPPAGFVLPDDWQHWYEDFRESQGSQDTRGMLIIQVQDEWNPRKEKRLDARKRVLAKLDRELDRIESVVRSVSKKLPAKSQPDHYDWFVRYQILGQSSDEIAEQAHRSPISVMEGIQSTADLVELDRRAPNRGGRPRKARSSEKS